MTPAEMEAQNRFMALLAASLDEYLNGNKKGADRTVGFVLLTFPFGVNLDGPDVGVNYIGNGDRDNVRDAMKKMLERWDEVAHTPVQKRTLG